MIVVFPSLISIPLFLPHSALSIIEQVDVTDYIAFEKAIRNAESKLGPVFSIVNNAGVMLLSKAHEQPLEETQQMLNVNVMGVINGVKIVINDFYKRKTGTIINVGSIAGRKIFADHASYCASKFAITAYTDAIREEAAQHNVRCVTIAPGVVNTELL